MDELMDKNMEGIQNREHIPSDSSLFFATECDYMMTTVARWAAGKRQLADEANPVIEFDAEHIHPSQKMIIKAKVESIKKSLEEDGGKLEFYPVGIKVGEEVYVVDGHHRTAAQIALYKKAKIRVVEVPEEEVQKMINEHKDRVKNGPGEQKRTHVVPTYAHEEIRNKIKKYKGGLKEYLLTRIKEEMNHGNSTEEESIR